MELRSSLKRALAGLCALGAAALLIVLGPIGGGSVIESAWADEPSGDALAAGPALVIKAGPATPVKDSPDTYSFPKLEVVATDPDRSIMSITVQFTSPITVNDEIYFTDSGDFTVFNASKHGNKSVNHATGATAEQWRDYLRDNLRIKLANSTDTKSLRMIASFEKVDRTLDYNSLNGHYYEAIMGSIGWREAFAAASTHEYMGMQGYLVTITSKEENDFVYSLVGTDCWMGATCDNNYTKEYSGGASTLNPGSHSVTYYWVSGPEKGQLLCTSDTRAHTHVPGKDENNEDFFLNWNPIQPDCGGGTESYMQFWTGDPSLPGSWNDLDNTNAGYRVNYVVEYGGLEDDPDGDDSSSGDADVDVFVKVDIDVDPTGKTITTEAYDVAVGEPLRVQENVNGDENVMTTVNGTAEPATVTRTYYVKDPDADGGWRPLRDDEKNAAGEPIHAGTYKVESSAVHSVGADGAEEPYKTGSDTFTIRPKALDITVPEIDTDGTDGPDGSGTAIPRTYTKVYDGTDVFAVEGVDLSNLVLDGADVRLACDDARYGTVAAGETTVTLEGARLTGAQAGDYTLAGVRDGALTVPARIVPRELVITAASTVRWGLAGKPLRDEAGAAVAFSSDEDVYGGGAWASNMLAPRDGHRNADGSLDSILGAITLTCEAEGLALNGESPEAAVYTVAVHCANVNPVAAKARAATAMPFAARAARDGGSFDPLTVKDLGGGRYDIGNYLLTLRPASVIVTADPKHEDFTGIGEVIEGTIDKKPVPGKDPLDKDAVEQLVDSVAGDRAPSGSEPSIVITKDGEEVDAIDPTEPGEYVIIATYPDPDGGEDKVVRIVYTVGDPDPGTIVVDDTVKVPVDPDGKPITKDELADEIGKEFGDHPDIPQADPVISITLDGEEVDAIDPTRPGTYVVTATYIDDDGNVSIVRRTYIVGADGDPGPVPGDPGKTSSNGSADGATRLKLLAATGDDGIGLLGAGAAALLAAAALVGLRRARRS